jgi:hypothetical protein
MPRKEKLDRFCERIIWVLFKFFMGAMRSLVCVPEKDGGHIMLQEGLIRWI